MRKFRRPTRAWLEETHSTRFELHRHFFLRLFDSDLISTPGQWQTVAGGVAAMLLSSSILYTSNYNRKYLVLNALPEPGPYRLAERADALFLVVLMMFLIALLTILEWPALFPGLRDYHALAGLPVRARDIFLAKFGALSAAAGLAILALTVPPAMYIPWLMSGQHAPPFFVEGAALLASCAGGAAFVFFTLVALQGVLLNLLPIRLFPRVSLALQGLLITSLLCLLPLVFSLPSLAPYMGQRPPWVVWAPPFWFLGLHQAMIGNHEPLAARLAWMGVAAPLSAALVAVLAYLWSYRRHKVRLLESPIVERTAGAGRLLAGYADRLIPDPRELGVFGFMTRTLGRSRPHRLVLTAFGALAVAVIFESFVSLALSRGFRGFSVETPALRQAVVSAPLALSLFVLAGFRYLFRLPVELHANWVFRLAEPGNRLYLLAAVERFLSWFAIAPIALLTLPLEMRLLGAGEGFAASVLCLLPSLALMELLLFQFQKLPFTSSYLPGKRPLIQTVVIYLVGAGLYVSMLGGVIAWAIQERTRALVLFVILLAAWLKARRSRLDDWQTGQLEFEELPEPAVHTLGIERD